MLRPATGATGTSSATSSTVPVNPGDYTANNPVPTGGAAYGETAYTGVSPGYIPPPVEGVKKPKDYSGLVNEKGEQVPFYNLNTNPREILAGMTEVQRKALLRNLYDRGWYGKDKPGGGLSDEDEKAMYRLLYSSNLTGVTWNQIYNLGKSSPFASDKTDGRIQVSSSEDLIEIANRTALSTIGRKLSPDEAAKFARAYQGAQQSEAGGGATAPSTEVYFQNRIEKEYGAESDGYKYLSAIGNVANLLENI